jgi:hypothetical protein
MTSAASHPTRRQLLHGGLAVGLTAAASTVLGPAPASAAPSTNPTSIHPFRVAIRPEQVAAMRRRVAATRWPSRELVTDRSQGVQLAAAQALARYWATRYDWRRLEAKLNAQCPSPVGAFGPSSPVVAVRTPQTRRLRSPAAHDHVVAALLMAVFVVANVTVALGPLPG